MKTFDDGVVMVEVPTGCFKMGLTEAEADALNKQDNTNFFGRLVPQSPICLTQFWIDQTDVTQEQFKRLGGTAAHSSRYPGANHPVEHITWIEARDYCAKRRNARLPTEAEWEYAARGPDSWDYPWGNTPPAADLAVYGTNQTADVGSKPNGKSWVGALDMAGNVWQWTSTIYDQSKFPYPYVNNDGRESIDNINDGEWRVVRGNAFIFLAADAMRSASRIGTSPGDLVNFNGFRCGRSS